MKESVCHTVIMLERTRVRRGVVHVRMRARVLEKMLNYRKRSTRLNIIHDVIHASSGPRAHAVYSYLSAEPVTRTLVAIA